MFKQIKVWLVLTTIFSLLALASACSKPATNEAPTNEAASTGEVYKSTGTEGTVTGVTAFNGTPAAPKKIDTSADPACGTANPNLATEDRSARTASGRCFFYLRWGPADGTKVAEYSFSDAVRGGNLDPKGCPTSSTCSDSRTSRSWITNRDPTSITSIPHEKQPNGTRPRRMALLLLRKLSVGLRS